MAASKARIVSRGLSHRLRVGFDRSGSAVVGSISIVKSNCAEMMDEPMGFPCESRCWIARIGANDDFTPLATAAITIHQSQFKICVQRKRFERGVTHMAQLLPVPWMDQLSNEAFSNLSLGVFRANQSYFHSHCSFANGVSGN
jgi:hypothetical protein